MVLLSCFNSFYVKLFQIFQLALCDIIVDNLNNWWPAHHSLPLMLCVGDCLLSWFYLVKNVQFLLQLVRIKILWVWASIQPCQPLCFVGVCTVTYGMQPQMWFLSLVWSSRNFCTCSLWIIFTFSTKWNVIFRFLFSARLFTSWNHNHVKCLYLFRNAFDQNRMTTKMMNDERWTTCLVAYSWGQWWFVCVWIVGQHCTWQECFYVLPKRGTNGRKNLWLVFL